MRSKLAPLAAVIGLAILNAGPATAAVSTLDVGCPWIAGSDAVEKNTGFPDTKATYSIISIPVNPGPSVKFVVRGVFPKIRYFGFQSYDGFRPGNLIDSLPDALITPVDGRPPAANPAVLPDSEGYTATYEIEIRYGNPPQDPAQREPNVLYAGLDSQRGALTKQVVYRTYLPNPGADRKGDGGLPDVHYVGPMGDIDLQDTPEQGRCDQIKKSTKSLTVFPVAGYATARPKWKPVSGAGQYVYYPNGDINYMKALVAARFADLVLVRAKMPATPVLPPVVVADPDVRYWSLCQNELKTSAVVDCVADRNMAVQEDGWVNVVISKDEKRPPDAILDQRYNWLPHGDADDAVAGFRQLLANPAFEGNYAKSVAAPSTPVVDVLGEWAPLITYCDRATFDAYAPQGGQAVFDACKKAYKPWNQIISIGG